MALCAKAFCVHFYKVIQRQLGRQQLSAVDGTLPIRPDEILPKLVSVVSVRSTSDRRRLHWSYLHASIPANVAGNCSELASDNRRLVSATERSGPTHRMLSTD
jgi:hypothetical protein